MKNYATILISGGLVAFALAAGACGGDSGGNGGGGTGGTTSSSSSSGTASSSSSSSGSTSSSSGSTSSSSSSGSTSSSSSGGTPMCEGFLNPSDCVTCLETSCCAELAACGEDGTCLDCATGSATDPTVCEDAAVAALIEGLNTCLESNCNDECIPKSECNPITNAGCTAAGSSCDLSNNGTFVCFDPPNDALCGATCSNSAGPFCSPGTTCNETKCTPYCCDDADCGANGTCQATGVSNIGVCIPKTAGELAVCDGPKPVTSGGSCYTP